MLLFSKFPSGVLLGVACMSSTHAERTEQYISLFKTETKSSLQRQPLLSFGLSALLH